MSEGPELELVTGNPSGLGIEEQLNKLKNVLIESHKPNFINKKGKKIKRMKPHFLGKQKHKTGN